MIFTPKKTYTHVSFPDLAVLGSWDQRDSLLEDAGASQSQGVGRAQGGCPAAATAKASTGPSLGPLSF